MAKEPNEPTKEEPASDGAGSVDHETPDLPIDVYGIVQFAFGLFATHAWQAMGLVPNPQTHKTEQDFEQARVAIDCAAFLAGRLEGHTSDERARDLRNHVQDLRINFVKQQEQAKEGNSSN